MVDRHRKLWTTDGPSGAVRLPKVYLLARPGWKLGTGDWGVHQMAPNEDHSSLLEKMQISRDEEPLLYCWSLNFISILNPWNVSPGGSYIGFEGWSSGVAENAGEGGRKVAWPSTFFWYLHLNHRCVCLHYSGSQFLPRSQGAVPFGKSFLHVMRKENCLLSRWGVVSGEWWWHNDDL